MKRKILFLMLIFFIVACRPQSQEEADYLSLQTGGDIYDPPVIVAVNEAGQLVIIPITSTPPSATPIPSSTPTATVKPTRTVVPSRTPTVSPTSTPTITATATIVATITLPTATPIGPILPFPSAPLCHDTDENHDFDMFHTVWDAVRGCYYDHEHGFDPFVPEVEVAFPGFDLYSLLGNVGVGHPNPSSPEENTHKHEGFKWFYVVGGPDGCNPRNAATIGVDAAVIQYHNFGDYEIELEARVHSALGLLRQCHGSNPTDYGYVYVNQHLDYGQRTAPYQGIILPYPDTPIPAYATGNAPYITIECYGDDVLPCGKYPTLNALIANGNTGSTWASEANHGFGSTLFGLIFRSEDVYKAIDASSDLVYPFDFSWFCGGAVYNPVDCQFNNSQTFINEVFGVIPVEWDNLAGFDMEPQAGRITADGFVTRFGDLNLSCTESGIDCHRIKLVRAFVGGYGSFLVSDKFDLHIPEMEAERDVYFCNGVVCLETDVGAVSSGWIGDSN